MELACAAVRGFDVVQDFTRSMERMGANGYMRARMARVRLLHAFIARLVGASLTLLHPSNPRPCPVAAAPWSLAASDAAWVGCAAGSRCLQS